MSDFSTFGPMFDICHCFWSWVTSIIALLIMFMYTVWHWPCDDILYVVGKFGLKTIVTQTSDFFKANPERDTKVWIELHTNSVTNNVQTNISTD